MPVTLPAPQVTTVTQVAPVSMQVYFGTDDSQTRAFVNYCACDGSGNLVPSAQPQQVQLSPADVATFLAAPGLALEKAQAALLSNLQAQATAVTAAQATQLQATQALP